MRRKAVSGIMLPLLLFCSLISMLNVEPVATGNTIYIRPDGSVDPPTAPIQRDGDIYTFTDNINDSIVVERDNIIVDGAGCTVQGTGSGTGINLDGRTNVTITDMEIKRFSIGVSLHESSDNIIAGNHITVIGIYGIRLSSSSNNNITANNITSSLYGVQLSYSSNNLVTGNVFLEGGLGVFYSSFENVVEDNLVNGKPMVYLEDASDYTVENAGQVILIYCNNITVENLHLSNTSIGIVMLGTSNSQITNNHITDNLFGIYLLDSSKNNTITRNNITNNGFGIRLYTYSNNNTITGNHIIGNSNHGIQLQASSNTITGNNITANNLTGISLHVSSNNTITENNITNNYGGVVLGSSSNNIVSQNNFIDNNIQAYVYCEQGYPLCKNIWDDNYPSGGNYWSDYTDVDIYGGPYQNENGSDGIWDHPYVIDADNQDRYPLVNPLAPNQPPTCSIELQKEGGKIDEIDVGQFFDIYVGDSSDDTGIRQVHFSSDDLQDGIPTGEWTEWYDWDSSSGDWNASTKIRRWSFATGGYKEVWAEVKDDIGQTDQRNANIFVHPGYAIIVAGKAGWIKKTAIDHAANNAYRVLRNLGFDDDHIFYLNHECPQDVDGNGDDEVDAPALLSNFTIAINKVKDKIAYTPTPLILYLVGHGERDFFEFDRDAGVEGFLWVDQLQEMLDNFSSITPMLIIIGSCFSGSFITSSESISAPNRIIITAAHDDHPFGYVGFPKVARFSDRFWGNLNKGLNVRESFVSGIWPTEIPYLLLDDNGDRIGHPPDNLGDDGEFAAATRIGIPNIEHLNLVDSIYMVFRSPGEVRVYDSQNRVTGLVNGEIKIEIPNSMYDEVDENIALFSPSDNYRYEVVGTETENYGLETAFIKDGDATTFTATDIPIQNESIHQYVVLNWTSLEKGEYVVQVSIDQDGDGDFEIKVMSDSEFTPHDIAVTNVTPSKNVVGEGYLISINVTIMNTGIYTESFNVTVFYNETAIILPDGKNHTTIALTSGNSTTITFSWNTTGVAKGNYTIKARATSLPGETDTTDNTYIDGIVEVRWPYDVTRDGYCGIDDIVAVAEHFGTSPGHPDWDPIYDVNCDDYVGIDDIVEIAEHFGETDP